jgi:hypothetical protein
VNPDLRSKIAAALRTRSVTDSFESGTTDADLSGIVADLYKALRGIVEQNEKTVQEVYADQGVDIELGPGAARLRFSDQDRERVLEELKRRGAFFYRRVFMEGEPDLRQAMKAFHEYQAGSGRPLRIRIRAADIYAPWQMLYSAPREASIEALGFWGFRYELGTMQKVSASQAPARTYLPPLGPQDVVFGSWRETDEVGERAGFLRDALEAAVGGEISWARSRDEFLRAIRDRSEIVKVVFFYGHASSGTVVQPSTRATAGMLSLPPTLASDWTGERLMFAANDHLVPLHVDELIPDYVFDDEFNPVFLKQHPIVVLDACETGAGGAEPLNNNGFVGRLSMAGAGAIFVTEAPVWRNFAYQFGLDLFKLIAAGEPMQTALYKARLRHLDLRNNPLGLIYSLYGNPALRLWAS